MKENLETSLKHLLGLEGGYVNDPHDNGGATKYGITIGTLKEYRGRPTTIKDVKALTWAEAVEIYKNNYWDAVDADNLPAGLDFAVFDFGVNSGPITAKKKLQQTLGVRADSIFGKATKDAIAKQPVNELINKYAATRLAYLKGLKDWQHYANGWTNRVNSAKKFASGLTTKNKYASVV